MTVDDDRPPAGGADDPLHHVPPDVEPPPDLHGQVVARLRSERLLDPPAPPAAASGAPWLRRTLAAAALVVAFVAGRATAPGAPAVQPGERVAAVPDDRTGAPAVLDVPGDAWALLLYEDARFDPSDLDTDELVAAYAAWAAEARDAGVLVLAEKLGDVEAELHGGGVVRRPVLAGAGAPGALTGLFVVRAPDEEAALDVARATPHHRLGGSVVVRPIDPT